MRTPTVSQKNPCWSDRLGDRSLCPVLVRLAMNSGANTTPWVCVITSHIRTDCLPLNTPPNLQIYIVLLSVQHPSSKEVFRLNVFSGSTDPPSKYWSCSLDIFSRTLNFMFSALSWHLRRWSITESTVSYLRGLLDTVAERVIGR